jgi:hypothetical protein
MTANTAVSHPGFDAPRFRCARLGAFTAGPAANARRVPAWRDFFSLLSHHCRRRQRAHRGELRALVLFAPIQILAALPHTVGAAVEKIADRETTRS